MRYICFFLLVGTSGAWAQFPLQPPDRPTVPLPLPTLPTSGGGYVVEEDGSIAYSRPDAVVLKPDHAITATGRVINLGWSDGILRTLPPGVLDVHTFSGSLGEGYISGLLALTAEGRVIGRGNFGYGLTVEVPPGEDNPEEFGYSYSQWVRKEIDSTIPPVLESDVVALAGGGDETHRQGGAVFLALKKDGQVVSWSPDPTAPAHYRINEIPQKAQGNIVAISGGGEHCLALTADGEVIAWGRVPVGIAEQPGSYGQMVLEYADAVGFLPTEVSSGVATISGNQSHAIALKDNGDVVQWGVVATPDGTALPLIPVPDHLFGGRRVVQAVVGHRNPGLSAVLLDDGTAVVWGYPSTYDTFFSAEYELPEFQFSRIALGFELYGLTSSALSVIEATTPEVLDEVITSVIQRILAHETNYGLATREYVDVQYDAAVGQGEAKVLNSPSIYGLFTENAVQDSREQGKNDVLSDPGAYSLYDETSILDLNLGGVMLQKSGDTATVSLQLQAASSLDQPFIDIEEPVSLSVELPGSKGFLRVRALGPQ